MTRVVVLISRIFSGLIVSRVFSGLLISRVFSGLKIKALVVLVLATMATPAKALCPQFCQCLWRASKITVDCGGAHLSQLPENIEGVTQVLNMTGASLPVLKSDMFTRAGLPNLQRLFLRKCNISSLHSRAFAGLINLVELDLTGNLLVTVPSHSFPSLPSLSTISLGENRWISSVGDQAFQALPNLLKIDLSDCRISSLAPAAFSGLPHLQRLLLPGNSLETLPDPYVFPLTLHQLVLNRNPWRCDCHLRPLREWLAIQVLMSMAPEPKCHRPLALGGMALKEVTMASLACAPTISPTSLHLTAEQGREVALHCLVESDPEAVISWSFNNSLLTAGNVVEKVVGEGRRQSSLTLIRVDSRWSGVFTCRAENPAGSSVGHYQLSVRGTDLEEATPRLLQLKLHYFVLVAAGSLVFFVLTSISVSLGCILVCRRRLKHVQEKESKKLRPDDPYPDILSDLAKSRGSSSKSHKPPSSSSFSLDTVTTPASVTSSMQAVIQPSRPPQAQAATLTIEGVTQEWSDGDQYLVHHHHREQSLMYPADFGLPRVPPVGGNLQLVSNRLAFSHQENLQFAQAFPAKQSLPMRADEQYPKYPEYRADFPRHFPPPSTLHHRPQGPHEAVALDPNQDHLYSQIHSLTISGYDHHQYESLSSPPQDAVWQAWKRAQGQLSRIQSAEALGQLGSEHANFLHITRYRKSASLPVLDDLEVDLCGETEI